MGWVDKLVRLIAGKALEDAVARQRVAEYICDLRLLCAEEGPYAFLTLLDVDEDTDTRQIAYLLVWAQGPRSQVWPLLQRFDVIDLAVDAAVEGFEAYLAGQTAEA